MRRRILICVAGIFYYSGLVALARWRYRRGPKLMILTYHRAQGGNLRQHLLYLRRHYRLLHVEAALEELYAQRKQGRSDRRTPLVLTFDDGYRDNYTHGFALARELQVPFTVYLVPGYIESGKNFWWVESERLVARAQTREVEVEGRVYRLDNTEERTALSVLLDVRARHAHSIAEREAFLAEMREKLAVPDTALEEELPAMPVTWEQVRAMEESGWVSFGAHTQNHPVLASITDPDELCQQIVECRVALKQHLGHPVHSFAYPIGQMQHISDQVLQIVREAGYKWAVTTNYGYNTPADNPYLLKRAEADIGQHWLVVAAEAAGLWGFVARLRWIPFIRKNFTNSKRQVADV
jgi:peptidoglycan/xylan/chitin deacetylase (PgdA/CDA1 family)